MHLLAYIGTVTHKDRKMFVKFTVFVKCTVWHSISCSECRQRSWPSSQPPPVYHATRLLLLLLLVAVQLPLLPLALLLCLLLCLLRSLLVPRLLLGLLRRLCIR